jgi:hypothetical protein
MCSIKRSDFMKQSDDNLKMSIQTLSEEIGSFKCRRGFVLSHFPETAEEASAFDSMIREKHPVRGDYRVFMFSVAAGNDDEKAQSTEALKSRAAGVLVHPSSGRFYNSNVPELAPQTQSIDDVTGEPLVCPKWDISSLGQRLNTWWNTQEIALKNYYSDRIQLINALVTRDQVSIDLSKKLLHTSEIDADKHKNTSS